MRKTVRISPWGLTRRQAAAMDAIVNLGCQKRAAVHLGVTVKTVEKHLEVARDRMLLLSPQLDNRVRRLVAWDRWRRSQSAGGQS